MWTQIAKTTISSIPTNNAIVVASLNNIQPGNFAVLTPFKNNCEIKRIVSVNTSSNTVTFSSPFNMPHAPSDSLYIQSSPNWDVSLFGASSVNSPYDNTTAINLAVKNCKLNNGGIVSFPKGIYKIERSSSSLGCIDASSLANVKFVGEGMGVSVLQLWDNEIGGADTHIFYCRKSVGLEWYDLTLDGNKGNNGNPIGNNGIPPQTHLIETVFSSDFIAERIEFINSIQDGIRITEFFNFRIINCFFGDNGRNGITGQRMTGQVTVSGCYFNNTKNSDIDMEPSYNAVQHNADITEPDFVPSPHKWIITNNIFDRNPKGTSFLSITLVGIGVNMNDEDFIVSNNIIQYGSIAIANCRNVVCDSNLIISGEGKMGDIPFQGIRLVNKFIFTNNIVVNNTENWEEALNLTYNNDKTTQGIVVTNNVFENGSCVFISCHDVAFTGNRINRKGKSGSDGLKILTPLPAANFWGNFKSFGCLKICDNQMTGVQKRGIYVSMITADKGYDLIHIDHNEISGDKLETGIMIDGKDTWGKLLIGTSNNIGDVIYDKIKINGSYQTGISEVPTWWMAKSKPNDLIKASQGSVAIDTRMVADNKYSKNQIMNPMTLVKNQGWEKASEMGRQVLFKDTFSKITPGVLLNAVPLANPFYHNPIINVFQFGWVEDNASISNSGNYWEINTSLKTATPHSSNPIATLESVVDCELKLQIKAQISSLGLSPNTKAGIAFRLLKTTSGLLKYWRFLFLYTNMPPGMPVTTFSMPYLIMETQGITTNPVQLVYPLYSIPKDERIVLKVMLKADYISAFYNDLLIWNIQNNNNQSEKKHGMMGGSQYFQAEEFTIISH